MSDNTANENHDPRQCTCHPSEAPVPCQRRYAFSECKMAAQDARIATLEARVKELEGALKELLAADTEYVNCREHGSIAATGNASDRLHKARRRAAHVIAEKKDD